MTTALDIIDRALEITKVKAVGQSSSADDADLGLRALKSMLEEWGIEPNSVIGMTELTFTPSAGTQSITIGTAGDIATTMPSRIDRSSFLRLSSVDYPIYFADTFAEYTENAIKSTQGFQCCCFWMPVNTGLGRLYLYPASNGGELHLWVDQDVINGYSTMVTGTTIIVPKGYKMAMEYSLAELLGIDFGINPAHLALIARTASNSRRVMKRMNTHVPQLNTKVLIDSGGAYDAQSDSYR